MYENKKSLENEIIDEMPPRHPDLYPTHLRLLNLSKPIFLHNSDLCKEDEISMVTIIHSAVQHEVSGPILQ